jgi:hypothetical protein
MRDAVKKYVEEMGITDSFFERMYNTDPSNIEILRGNQSEKIIPFRDPVYDEIYTAERAQEYGLTTSEYRKRDLLGLDCPNIYMGDCQKSIMWGLSLEECRSRQKKVYAICPFYTKSEARLYDAIPTKDRHSLPFVAKRIACEVSIMSGK